MATTDLSKYDASGVPSGAGLRFGLVVSAWNPTVTSALRDGAVEVLLTHGVAMKDILEEQVPGSYELALGAQLLIEGRAPDAVICIGSVVRGETPHFEYVCQATAQGIMDVNLRTGVPVIFCVLTDDHMDQALARSGGIHGNKGVEAAVAALRMARMRQRLSPNG